jgi:hypothetical protein
MCGLARLVYGVATLSICFSFGIIVQYEGVEMYMALTVTCVYRSVPIM